MRHNKNFFIIIEANNYNGKFIGEYNYRTYEGNFNIKTNIVSKLINAKSKTNKNASNAIMLKASQALKTYFKTVAI